MAVTIDQMAGELMKIMDEVRETSADELKKSIRQAGKDIASEIKQTAPRETGKYASSWRSSVVSEGAESIQVTVYSPNRYQIAHLLEHGHAKRNGGRVRAIPHIEPAEEKIMGQMESDLKRSIESKV
jgi:hypothetical protein